MTRPLVDENVWTDILPVKDKHLSREDSWSRVIRRLKTELGENVYSSWFARLELDDILDGTAHLSVPTKFLKSWIESHYREKLLGLLSSEIPHVERMVLSFRTAPRASMQRSMQTRMPTDETEDCGTLPAKLASHTRPGGAGALFLEGLDSDTKGGGGHHSRTNEGNAESTRDSRSNGIASLDGFSSSPLDRRNTFDSFLVGPSNQFAHAASMTVARGQNGAALPYNPLYIHAAVGLGKTHLLQAIAHAVANANRRVFYLTAEKFMYGFVSSLKSQTTIAFKEKLRSIDVLVIDDIQFLQGKSIQQEFCHTLNALIDAGHQVVIASDRPPSELEALEERVRSRLAGGLCIEMGALDTGLRARILEARISAARQANPGFDVSPTVISYVAGMLQTNGRDLEGAVNRMLAHATLTGQPLTIETAEIAIRDLIRVRDPKRVKIEDIQKLVATHYNISRADLLSARRTAGVVRPRQIAMFLAKALTLRSLPEIGRRFGGRDHTTVLHAVRKIEGLTGADHSLGEEIELLKRMLLD